MIPDRERVLAALARTNRWRRPLVALWLALSGLSLAAVDPAGLAARPLVAALAVGVVLSGTGMAAMAALFRKQRWLEDLPPDRVLGRFDRAALLALSERVHQGLGLRERRPVALTGDKELNASVMMLGLGGLFPRLNAIYIHRPMLHVLDADELASVLGHELAHYYRHKIEFVWDTWVHDLLLCCLGLALVSRVDWGGMELVAVAGLARAQAWALGQWVGRYIRVIEFLCDDAGAEVAGWLPAINTELKLGLEAETELRLQAELLREGGDIPAARLIELYSEALPFGREDPDALRRRLRERLAQERGQRQGLSVGGYLEYLSGEDPEARQQLNTQILPELPLLDWDREALRRQGGLSAPQVAELVQKIVSNPDRLLFQLPVEVGIAGLTHPSHTRRVLYLWHYRDTIEQAARARGAPTP